MSQLASVATAEDLQRKLAAKIETMKKEASELLKIAAQSRKEIQELLSSAEKRLGEFTVSKDPSDQDFFQIARYLDKTKNILVLILSKSAGDSVIAADASDYDDDIIKEVLPESHKILLKYLNKKLRSIFKYFLAEEWELAGIEEIISGIITELSKLATNLKNFTGTRKDQFSSYSEKSRELFEIEVKLESVGFRLVGVSSTMESLEKFNLEEDEKVEAVENNTEVGCEEAKKETNTIAERTSAEKSSSGEEGFALSSFTEEFSNLTSEDTAEEVSFAPEKEEVLSSRQEDSNTEVSPRPLESPVATTPVPVSVHSSVQSQQMKKIKQLQVENLKKDLSVFGSFSLSPGSYSSFNVFYVEGTSGKFWLSVDNGALTEFNFLIKVFIKKNVSRSSNNKFVL